MLKAGTDVDCTSFVGKNAQSALDKKLIDEAEIDKHLVVLMKVRIRLGHFDPVGPLQSFPMTDVCSDYAIALSNDGPVQSSALIKNIGGALPLTDAVKTVAVIGPNYNLSKADVGYYGPHDPCDKNYWTLMDAVTKHSSATATGIAGVPNVLSEDTSGIAAAVAMAKTADEVILAVGTDLTWAHEEHDAMSITFTKAQAQLIKEVSAAAKKPVILGEYTPRVTVDHPMERFCLVSDRLLVLMTVTMTATPLDLTDVMANPKIGAVMHLGQPSVTVVGVGELLFGKTSPAGRTVQTVYNAAYAVSTHAIRL